MRNTLRSVVVGLATVVAAMQGGQARAQTYCDDLREALSNGSNENYLAHGEFTKSEYRLVVWAQRKAERQACANTAEARKLELVEQAIARGVAMETITETYNACGPYSSRRCTEDTIRSMLAGAQGQPNLGAEDAADLAASFLTGFIGGVAAGAVPTRAAPAVRFARPSVTAPRTVSVVRTSPAYVPTRATMGQTVARPVATSPTYIPTRTTTGPTVARPATTSASVKSATATGGTITSGSSTAGQRQGCAGLRAAMNQSAVLYTSNPSQHQADVARYNSLCGQ